MTIDADHWLVGVRRVLISGGSPMAIRRCLVIHATAGATGASSIAFWKTPAAKGASAHVVIERTGEVIQCRPFNLTCGHAGVSRWRDPHTGRKFIGLNSCSIGIELANALADEDVLKWAEKQPGFFSVRAEHRNESRVQVWEGYQKAQVDACTEVARACVARYSLDDVTGHQEISPSRRNDPGPAFNLERLRNACGFSGLPVVHWS